MSRSFLAAIFDLDGVITDTASSHARAWKTVVDPLLDRPFELVTDYATYLAGRPRIDGIRDFLMARGMTLSEAALAALASRKNSEYLRILESDGVRVNEQILSQMSALRAHGLKIAIASSSKNARTVLKISRIDFKGILVDGNDVEILGLRPKPAPDIFVYTARQLGVEMADCMIFEDSPETLAQVSPAHGILVSMS